VISLSRRARRIVIANLSIAATFITVLVLWDLLGHLPLHAAQITATALRELELRWRDRAGEHEKGCAGDGFRPVRLAFPYGRG
jgi:hypothetical protein